MGWSRPRFNCAKDDILWSIAYIVKEVWHQIQLHRRYGVNGPVSCFV